MIVAFRYLPRFPEVATDGLGRLRKRLERFRAVPPIRAFIAELKEAEKRSLAGEPAHLPEMILRLTRAAIVRNTVIEETTADERDESIRELARLREDVHALIQRRVRRRDQPQLLAEVEERFETARFPFRHNRAIPRITVRGSAEGVGLDPGVRRQQPWPDATKRALIDQGYALADAELRRGRHRSGRGRGRHRRRELSVVGDQAAVRRQRAPTALPMEVSKDEGRDVAAADFAGLGLRQRALDERLDVVEALGGRIPEQ